MRVAEIFESVQGEGLLAGTRSVFVRSTGCNLRCWFCDTRYTSWEPEGRQRSVEAILDALDGSCCRHAVITGGEPMLQPDIVPLSQELDRRGYHVTIETAGTVYRPVVCDLMSLSPKLSNSVPLSGTAVAASSGEQQRAEAIASFSRERQRAGPRGSVWDEEESVAANGRWVQRHEQTRINATVLRRLLLEYEYQVKFVIDEPQDVDEVEEFLGAFREIDRDRVLLMPQAAEPEELAEKSGWIRTSCSRRGLRFGPRLHIEQYGNVRGR